MKDLTDRQKQFAREYVLDFNATQAAIRAGYSKKSARVQAAKLLKVPGVQAFARELVQAKAEATELSVERVLRELQAMAFVDPLDLFNGNGQLKNLEEMPASARRAIAGIDFVVQGRGEDAVDVCKVRLTDKKGSLELLARYLQMFVDKSEITHGGNVTFKMVYHEPEDAGKPSLAARQAITGRREELDGTPEPKPLTELQEVADVTREERPKLHPAFECAIEENGGYWDDEN